MSRIAKKPILLPPGVKMTQNNQDVRIDGPRGTLSMIMPEGVDLMLDNNVMTVHGLSQERKQKSYLGLVRTLVSNMVAGVTTGVEKSLIISGVGYRAEVIDARLKLLIGYSVPVEYLIPEGVTVKVDKQVNITVSGIDKQLIGRVAAEIRELKKPEPYKGKGIRYATETIRRKVGKSVGSK
ncbi:MAG: 50S ribosomal protein L6 [Smithellaceae bacterium]|nr:50S ribosomal protein L6 [Smithellaceae bacterium]